MRDDRLRPDDRARRTADDRSDVRFPAGHRGASATGATLSEGDTVTMRTEADRTVSDAAAAGAALSEGDTVTMCTEADRTVIDSSRTGNRAHARSGWRALKRRIHPLWLALPAALLSLAVAVLSLARGNALFIGVVLVVLSMVPFLWRFERRERGARELVLIAAMAAVATVSRIPFAVLLPGITPVTFIVIVSGVVFGAEAGWMVGAVTGLVSNFFLGQGPWTPWQMFAWGMAGFTAGLFAHRSPMRRRRLPLALFGAAWGLGFGWFMNITVALDVWVKEQTWSSVMAVYALGLPFDALHAIASIFFIAVFAPSWIQLLERYRRKYGALQRTGPGASAGEEDRAHGQGTFVNR